LSTAGHHGASKAAPLTETNQHRQERTVMHNHEGLPAAATVEQAIILAQLQILRRIERQRNMH
jgi:hypothetical protein